MLKHKNIWMSMITCKYFLGSDDIGCTQPEKLKELSYSELMLIPKIFQDCWSSDKQMSFYK